MRPVIQLSREVSDRFPNVEGMEIGSARRVRIGTDGPATRLEIDGQVLDPASVVAWRLDHLCGAVPQLVLQLVDRGPGMEFEGTAEVVVGVPPDAGPAAAEFLQAMDAGELERAALSRLDLDSSPHALTRAMLATLVEWARGD